MSESWMVRQRAFCAKQNVPYVATPEDKKVGISRSGREHIYPLNGLRLEPGDDTAGWFIWGGSTEPSTDPDFFEALHVAHLVECCPDVLPYLGLPPGWRFLIAPDYEDVWFDASLIDKPP